MLLTRTWCACRFDLKSIATQTQRSLNQKNITYFFLKNPIISCCQSQEIRRKQVSVGFSGFKRRNKQMEAQAGSLHKHF